jgi:hypothetical protein
MNYDMDRDGFCVLPHVISDDVLAHLIQDIDATIAAQSHEQQRRQTSVHSLRNVIEGVPSVRDFINSPSMRALVEPILGPNCSPVRGILFDKVGANWKVPWHQIYLLPCVSELKLRGSAVVAKSRNLSCAAVGASTRKHAHPAPAP